MKKLKYLVPFMPALAMAQSSTGTIDLSAAETAAGNLQTAITGFFNTTVGPMVLAVGGVVFAVTMIIVLFRWARKIAK